MRLDQAHLQRMSSSLVAAMEVSHHCKKVISMQVSYSSNRVGLHAASVLSQRLPPSHRVILIERNSHFNRKS